MTAFRLLLVVGLAVPVLTAVALGGVNVAPPARIVFASNATSAFGEHTDVVAVDAQGRPRRVGDLRLGALATLSPDGRRVAFLRQGAANEGLLLYVMNADGTDQRQLTEKSENPDSTGIAEGAPEWSPDGRLITFVRLGGTIGIAAADGSSVRHIDMEHADAPAWSPDGKTIAYTTSIGDGELFLADADGSHVRRLAVGSSAPGWSPDGGTIAITHRGQLSLVNPETGERRRLTTKGLDAGVPVWSPDGRRIAFEGSDADSSAAYKTRLWTIEPATGRLERLTGVLRGWEWVGDPLSWSPGGRWLAYLDFDGFVQIVDSRKILPIRTLSSWPPRRAVAGPRWLRDGRLIVSTAVKGNDQEIYRMNADGSGVRPLTENRIPDIEPTGSPDGRQIAYVAVNGEKHRIQLMRSDGTNKRPLLPGSRIPQESPAWSPRGTEIAFVSLDVIYLVTPGGRSLRRLVTGYEPAWASDGQTLVFNSAAGISLIRRDGTGLQRAPGFRLPSLSPDGTQLAFQRPVADNANGVFVADVKTRRTRLLVSPGRDPAWSPDGTRIAYDTKSAIWTVPIAGGQPTRLTTLNGTAQYAAWLGDGR